MPERWLKTTTGELSYKNVHPFVSLPFGFGPRSCIGKRFANLEMETLIAKVSTLNHPYRSLVSTLMMCFRWFETFRWNGRMKMQCSKRVCCMVWPAPWNYMLKKHKRISSETVEMQLFRKCFRHFAGKSHVLFITFNALNRLNVVNNNSGLCQRKRGNVLTTGTINYYAVFIQNCNLFIKQVI